jgi:hypothetical protein
VAYKRVFMFAIFLDCTTNISFFIMGFLPKVGISSRIVIGLRSKVGTTILLSKISELKELSLGDGVEVHGHVH